MLNLVNKTAALGILLHVI